MASQISIVYDSSNRVSEIVEYFPDTRDESKTKIEYDSVSGLIDYITETTTKKSELLLSAALV